MELVTVDAPETAPKNYRVTKDERKRLGRKLRALRIERALNQSDVVKDPKANDLSLGTLQAIESAWYEVRDQNIEKYARFFGTSMQKLLRADEPKVAPTDSRFQDLNEEHLELARQYMRARKRIRAAAEIVLAQGDDDLAGVVLKLATVVPADLHHMTVILDSSLVSAVLALADRLTRCSPEFYALVTKTIDAELSKPAKPAALHPPGAAAKP
jgi:hypothetical protein